MNTCKQCSASCLKLQKPQGKHFFDGNTLKIKVSSPIEEIKNKRKCFLLLLK